MMTNSPVVEKFVTAIVKRTDYGLPPTDGVQSLKERLQYFNPSLLGALQQSDLSIYLLNSGEDPAGAGRESFDAVAFPTPEDHMEIKALLLNLQTIDKKYGTSNPAQVFDAYCREFNNTTAHDNQERFGILGINPFHGITCVLIDMPNLGPQTTLGQVAAIRTQNGESLDYVRFLSHLRDCNPHLFKNDSNYQEIASVAVKEIPIGTYCVVPNYVCEITDTGKKYVNKELMKNVWKWRQPERRALGYSAARPWKNKPIIYFSSPILAPSEIYSQNLAAHELTHLLADNYLRHRDPVAHKNLYEAAQTTFKREASKEKDEKKLSDLLVGYETWGITWNQYTQQFQTWSSNPENACQELVGYSGGFVFSAQPDVQLQTLEDFGGSWAKTFRAFISRVESLSNESSIVHY